jgi:hypothetical protein
MAEIIVVWILALIVLAIAWGVMDRITVPLKACAQWWQSPERTKRFEIAIASFLALAVLSIVVAEADSTGRMPSLPALMLWAGGLWLIPFRFDAVGQYWLFVLALGVILALFWTRNVASLSTPARTDVSIQQRQETSQQGQEASASLTGLGVLFWIFMIGLTVATIARYTSTANAVALNS